MHWNTAAELLLRKPWMPGMSDIEQLSLIFQNLGTPSQAVWPGAKGLPNYVEFQATAAPPLKTIFPKVSHVQYSTSSILTLECQATAEPPPPSQGHLPKGDSQMDLPSFCGIWAPHVHAYSNPDSPYLYIYSTIACQFSWP